VRRQSSPRPPERSLIRTAAKIYLAPFMALAILMGVLLVLGLLIFGVQLLTAAFKYFQI
jgi:hypothetical protein